MIEHGLQLGAACEFTDAGLWKRRHLSMRDQRGLSRAQHERIGERSHKGRAVIAHDVLPMGHRCQVLVRTRRSRARDGVLPIEVQRGTAVAKRRGLLVPFIQQRGQPAAVDGEPHPVGAR